MGISVGVDKVGDGAAVIVLDEAGVGVLVAWAGRLHPAIIKEKVVITIQTDFIHSSFQGES
jgi:hypothetical protein